AAATRRLISHNSASAFHAAPASTAARSFWGSTLSVSQGRRRFLELGHASRFMRLTSTGADHGIAHFDFRHGFASPEESPWRLWRACARRHLRLLARVRALVHAQRRAMHTFFEETLRKR